MDTNCSDGSCNDPGMAHRKLLDHLQINSRPPICLSVAEVKAQAHERIEAIFSSWNRLNAILQRHESLVRRRWLKKSRGQRKKILLQAWPLMPPSHRPEFLDVRQGPSKKRRLDAEIKNAYFWPAINLEDLSQGNTLLLFLSSRGRHLPDEFAHADLGSVHLGVVTHAIPKVFLDKYIMLLFNQKTPETYGRIIEWSDKEEAFDCKSTWIGMRPGEGLLVLEIQEGVLRFLDNFCTVLLHDVSPEMFTGKDIPTQPEPGPVSVDSTAWSSLAVVATEAPYRVPAHLDFERLQAMISAKRSASKDHSWSLREDPGYFNDFILECRGHRSEGMRDVKGRTASAFDTPNFWNNLLSSVVVKSYEAPIVWDLLYDQITQLANMKENAEKSMQTSGKIPLGYEECFQQFQFTLTQAANNPVALLKRDFAASPAARSLFERTVEERTSGMSYVQDKNGIGENLLIFYFSLLFDKHSQSFFGLTNIMDEIGRLLHNEPSQKQLLSPLTAQHLSELSLLTECLHQLELYQPWAAAMESSKDSKTLILRFFYDTYFVVECLEALEGVDFGFGNPLDGKFRYPSEKRRTRENVEAMRAAEKNLDVFWQSIDEKVANTSQGAHDLIYSAKNRKMRRTPEWAEEQVSETRLKQAERQVYIPPAFQSLSFQEKPSKADLSLVERSSKIKTRGVARMPSDVEKERDGATEQEDSETSEADQRVTFAVSKRALKVFSTLFSTPAASSDAWPPPGEISWADFLHAMTSTGFSAEKLHGSAWQFTPSSSSSSSSSASPSGSNAKAPLDVERSIQFHEPHPESRIAFRVARRMGRRLNRVYGWSGELFVQRSNGQCLSPGDHLPS